jgi:hypothetical protein
MTPDLGHTATHGRRRMTALLGGVAVAMAIGGCGSGPAIPPPIAPSHDVGMAATLTRVEADPCRILSGQDAARLGVGSGTLVTSHAALGGNACRLTNFPDKPDTTPGKTYLVQLLDNPGNLTVDADPVPPINEFPARRGTPTEQTADNTCAYVVDLAPQAAPGRYLWVQYTNLARDDPSLNHHTACDDANAATIAAIASMKQTAG